MIDFNKLYICSSDTLGGILIDQGLDGGWNDRPPLFVTKEDDDKLLKGVSSVPFIRHFSVIDRREPWSSRSVSPRFSMRASSLDCPVVRSL